MYSDPIYVVKDKPLVSADSDLKINEFADMEGKTTCLPKSWTVPSWLKKVKEKHSVKLQKPRSLISCLRLIKAGRVDFFVLASYLVKPAAKKEWGSFDEFRYIDFVATKTADYAIFPKSSGTAKQDAKQLNKALKGLKDSGAYQKLWDKHLK